MKVNLKGINKSFGCVKVLKDVNLNINHSEVHALMGENGAGKSTLIKIITGVYTKDSGVIEIDNSEVLINNIKDGQKLGIAYVHQELNVIRDMSVMDNLFLGRELKTKNGIIDYSSMHDASKKALDQLHLDINPKILMKNLSVGYQQMIEIAKALLQKAQLIILDEPTAALTNKEIQILFVIVKKLQKNGVSFLYVSHRMGEIFEISDMVTVLRDGRYVDTVETKLIDEDELVKMMTGKKLDNLFQTKKPITDEKVLEVIELNRENKFYNVSFDLYKGEVLGFSGLIGSGRSEIMHCLFGSDIADSGQIIINGNIVKIEKPIDAYNQGIAFVTEDRKEEGLILDFAIDDNIMLPSLKKVKNFFIQDSAIDDITKSNIKKLNIKCNNNKQLVKNLSGGNQQKVVFSKWIETNPKILILDEPTRGVDIGAKKEIYDIIDELKKEGVSIILVSSDLPEVIGLSDRIAVMQEKRLIKIFDQHPFNQDQILKVAFLGGKAFEKDN